MIWWRRTPPETTIDGLYGTIVAQARLPIFYTEYGVPDSVEGRFEMIVLHQA
jgi:cytochrome b pre-mRNA-processing protein 3